MPNSNLNWMVPLRRAVVKGKGLSYREFLDDWLDQLRDTDNSFVLGIWYRDPDRGDFSPADYNKGLASLRRWVSVTFGEQKVATSPVGITTLQTRVPNFHCRFWKGPKRVLLEQAAGDDEAKRAELQPFDLVGGRIDLQTDEQGKPKDVKLLPGDVLEVPLHEFLVACGQKRFEDIEFDPGGSFYLGTTVRSKSGRKRTELPRLHDNLLAMRFQLVTALNMGNGYHDAPVYTDTLPVNKKQLRPEGAGVFARGMPYGGNASATPKTDPQLHWQVSQLHTNLPKDDRPIYLPTHASLLHYADGLPLTWGWTCTPWTLLYFNLMADSHQTQSGLLFPGSFRGESLAQSLCLSTNKKNNEDQLAAVHAFQDKNGKDPLLLHKLELSHVQLPREQPPLADLCEIVFPADRSAPEGRPFTDPNGNRIKPLPLPTGKTIDTHDWNDLCPGAGLIVVSSAEGHEYGLTKLYKPEKILKDAKAALAKNDFEAARLPVAGCLSAYNPLSGEDYCSGADVAADGHFFVNESSAKMVPKNRDKYANLQLAEVRLHKFQPTPNNKAQFRLSPDKDKELQISDTGGKFRSKKVSAIFYLREGKEGDPDPRTLANIYAIPRESWIPVALSYPSKQGTIKGFEALYAQRAVPFPTILEVAAELPDRARVAQQLENHRVRLVELGDPNAEAAVNAEIAAATSSSEKKRLERDLALLAKDEQKQRKWETLRKALVALVSASPSPSPKDDDE